MSSKRISPRICKNCGNIIVKPRRTTYCSDKCSNEMKNCSRTNINLFKQPKAPTRHVKSIQEIARLAKEAGVSYGEYQAAMDAKRYGGGAL